ncbi:unnamed protein product [Bursaphelenchus okinawaensis]|uniref:Fatty-acid and retinol-binding protein 1 n=1 Tax=Bursaphelenchus okinawaensis TaxID=465554 RepID=A0A811L954_9BILA|nr:unnamed protein product [Bursaphelenchus okinawaensis]CAG9118397.1 unnamed protein product [Bursaphelenchus okinawaensis]
MRVLLFILLLLSVCQCKFHDVHPALRSLLPSNILNFLDTFTPEEQKVIDSADDSTGVKEYLHNIEKQNPDLAQRATILVANIITKMNSLPNATHDFVRKVMKALDAKEGKLSDEEVTETASKLEKEFKKLSPEDQDELQFVFPTIFDTLTSEEFAELAKGKFGKAGKEDAKNNEKNKEKEEKKDDEKDEKKENEKEEEEEKTTTTTKKPKSKKNNNTTTVAPTTVAE